MSRAVIDQPGVRIFIIGIILSVFLGMAIKTQISEVKIQGHLNKSIEKLQADFHVDYESARINLARWGLPIPALIITNLRLSPKSILCQNSQIFIDELEIPVSLLSILGIRKSIPKVRLKQIELRLSDIDKCVGNSNSAKTKFEFQNHASGIDFEKREPAASDENTSSFKSIFINKTKAELREVYIEKLKVISDKKIDQPILLRQLNVELTYDQNRLSEVKLKSKFNAIKDERSELYFLTSDLDGIVRSKNQNLEFIFSVSGKLLDGDAKFFTHGNLGQNRISYELSLDRVSAKAMAPLMSHFNIDRKKINYEKLPISISFKNSGKITLDKEVEIESSIRNLQIIIDGGTLVTDFVSFEKQGDKYLVKPFYVKIEQIPLTHLKSLESLKENLDSFDSLGNLSGHFEFKNNNSFNIKGSVVNATAIFSNRGRRDLQKINNLDIQVSKSGTSYNILAQNIRINDILANGTIVANYNTSNSQASGIAKLSNVILNDQVWEQFTFVEQSPKIQLTWNYSKNLVENHNLNLEVESLLLPGVKLSDLTIDLKQSIDNDGKLNKLMATIKPKILLVEKVILENEEAKKIFDNSNYSTMQSRNAILKINGQSWLSIFFELNMDILAESTKSANFKFSGSINPKQGLVGRVTTSTRNKVNKFEIIKKPDEKLNIKDFKL